jgi:hypothetical protein
MTIRGITTRIVYPHLMNREKFPVNVYKQFGQSQKGELVSEVLSMHHDAAMLVSIGRHTLFIGLTLHLEGTKEFISLKFPEWLF